MTETVKAWSDYETDIESMNKTLYGVDGLVHGSMYTEILPYILEKEYQLYAGSLMAVEYEAAGEYTAELSFVDKGADVSSADVNDFTVGSLCLEWDEDLQNTAADLDSLTAAELEDKLESVAVELDEKTSGATDIKKFAADYVVLVNNMNALELAVTGNSERCEKVKEQRLILAIDHILSIIKVMDIEF